MDQSPDGASSTSSAGPRFVAVIVACMAMTAVSIDLCLPAFAAMRRDFALAGDSVEVSRVITVFFMGLALGQVVFGPLSDRYGRKGVLQVGLVIYVAGAVGAAISPSLGGVLAFRFVWGFGAAAPRSLALAMVRDRLDGDQMARILSIAMAILLIVPMIAPTIGTGLIAVVPWRVVFWLPAIAGVIVGWVVTTQVAETHPPGNRRPISVGTLVEAAREVVGNRRTMGLTVAATFMFGAMVSYLGSVEIIIEEVFDRGALFPLLFGLVGLLFAVSAIVSSRIVVRIGVDKLISSGAVAIVLAAACLALVALVTDGRPPLWLFASLVAVFMPMVTALIPNCNTAAMMPLPHVAGMAAAVIGSVSTLGGAVLGTVSDRAFDGTVLPFALHELAYAAIAACAMLWCVRVPEATRRRPAPALAAVNPAQAPSA